MAYQEPDPRARGQQVARTQQRDTIPVHHPDAANTGVLSFTHPGPLTARGLHKSYSFFPFPPMLPFPSSPSSPKSLYFPYPCRPLSPSSLTPITITSSERWLGTSHYPVIMHPGASLPRIPVTTLVFNEWCFPVFSVTVQAREQRKGRVLVGAWHPSFVVPPC